MEKSIYTADYRRFLRLLRDARMKAGVTQRELADELGQTQSFISKCERGERRLDLLETKRICAALGIPFLTFVRMLDQKLERK